MKKLFVGGLSADVDEEMLKHEFQNFGEVADVIILRDKLTGASRNFGFIEFFEDAAADLAMASMNGKVVWGRKIGVNLARPRE